MLHLNRKQNCVEPSALGRVVGGEPSFNPTLLHVPKVLVKPEKMEMSSQRTSGPFDWLQLCTQNYDGWGLETYRLLLWRQLGRKAQTQRLCVLHTPLQNYLSKLCEEKCHVIVLQYVHWVLLGVSWGQSALMTWIVTQLCFTSTFTRAAELQGFRGCCCSQRFSHMKVQLHEVSVPSWLHCWSWCSYRNTSGTELNCILALWINWT